jgi:hypothetical protein
MEAVSATDSAGDVPTGRARSRRWVGAWAAVGFAVALAAYHAIFGPFFPNAAGQMGHDYSYTLPMLLAGRYWIEANGLFEVPWFTPAFCGGQPYFADPQSFFYSVAQAFALATDPVNAVYWTLLSLATAGFWGTYAFCRGVLGTGRPAAFLAAVVFMFNGFFAHRMIVGHYTFHSVMLLPWIAWALAMPLRTARALSLVQVAMGVVAGLLLAYLVIAGLGTLLLPGLLAVAALLILGESRAAVSGLPTLAVRGASALMVMVGVSASRLAASLAYLANFPRTDYRLPGYDGILDAVGILFDALFLSPPDIAARSEPLLRNVQWALGRHELEYGVTLLPLVVVPVGAWFAWRSRDRLDPRRAVEAARRRLLWGAFAAILVLPVALNVYDPDWNEIVKRLPLIGASSTLVRWYMLYVPIAAIAVALGLQKAPAAWRLPVAVVGGAFVLASNAVQDRADYHREPYPPGRMVAATRATEASPVEIRRIGAYHDDKGQPYVPIFRNDALAQGVSQLACYNPVFGYGLEKFPVKDLHEGPITEITNGHLNLKNPACYVYPGENGCTPGDHFTEAQRGEALAFAAYRPFPFKISTRQRYANGLTQVTLAASLIVLLAALPAAWPGGRARRRAGAAGTPLRTAA